MRRGVPLAKHHADARQFGCVTRNNGQPDLADIDKRVEHPAIADIGLHRPPFGRIQHHIQRLDKRRHHVDGDALALAVAAAGGGGDKPGGCLQRDHGVRPGHRQAACFQKRRRHADAIGAGTGMRRVRLQDDEGGIGARIDGLHYQIDRTGGIGPRGQHQLTAKRRTVIAVQPCKPFGQTGAGNVGDTFDGDIAQFTLGMGVDHADRRCGGHFLAAARSAVMVVRGEMASVEVTISTMAPVGESQAR